MVVREIPNDLAFEQFLAEATTKLIVIDFYASWCRPCRMISREVERLSEKYQQAIFVKVNVSVCSETCRQFAVHSMPTFVFLKSGHEVDRMIGADPDLLETKIMQHCENVIMATANERDFLEKLLAYSQRMQIYEDDISQALARSLIPYEKLMEASKVDGKTNEFELLKLLLKWYKTEFFTWTDTPKCEFCGKNTNKSSKNGNLHLLFNSANTSALFHKKSGCYLKGSSSEIQGIPTEEEQKLGADQVEVYKCQNCKTEVRFPRYNDPTKLLETRCGRCGEWANCFMLCCRAMDFEARWVYDVTDHVWCEVWINSLDRWVHCDPCENVVDTALLYEKGWKKKLSYVIAFGRDHIRDVSWRYTFNHLETLKRRDLCREAVLRNFIKDLNHRYESIMPEERKKEMERRYMKELVEFISPNMQLREGSEVESQGRTTGSKEWRNLRGEDGDGKSISKVIIPTTKEFADKIFSLEYDCVKDQYRRGDVVINGWESLISRQENVCRVVDQSENMAYFCSQEYKKSSELCWSFDFGVQRVRNIEFFINGIRKEDEDLVKVVICCGDVCTLVPPSGALKIETFEGSKMDVKICLSGKAQLFQVDLLKDSKDCFCFRVNVYFS